MWQGARIVTRDLLDRLNAVASDNINAIVQLQDFQVFTGHSYDRYSKMVDAGHLKESVTNARTNTSASSKDLSRQLIGYLDGELPLVCLYQIVAHFEAFFFDFLALLLLHNPHALSAKRQVTVGEVLEAAQYETLLERLIQAELAGLRYSSPADWFAFLRRIVNLDAIKDTDIARLAELKATRDVCIHNRGIANEIYLGKSGAQARVRAGEQLPVARAHTYESADFLREFIRGLADATIARLAPAT